VMLAAISLYRLTSFIMGDAHPYYRGPRLNKQTVERCVVCVVNRTHRYV